MKRNKVGFTLGKVWICDYKIIRICKFKQPLTFTISFTTTHLPWTPSKPSSKWSIQPFQSPKGIRNLIFSFRQNTLQVIIERIFGALVKYSQLNSIIWPVWLNGWVFIYELSGCWFESSCSHLILL